MALIQGSFYSKELKMASHFQAFLPFDTPSAQLPLQVLILLHGLMDNCDTWVMQTDICRRAAEAGVLLFLPEGHRSFYSNMCRGGAYANFVQNEIPEVIKIMFGFSLTRENTVIAGNSMGGYGALKAAFRQPGRFGRCAALSPVIQPLSARQCIPDDYLIANEEHAVWKDGYLPGDDQLAQLIPQAAAKNKSPNLYIACGKQDFLLDQNRKFQNFIRNYNITCAYEEPEGEHGWAFWQARLPRLFEWLSETAPNASKTEKEFPL